MNIALVAYTVRLRIISYFDAGSVCTSIRSAVHIKSRVARYMYTCTRDFRVQSLVRLASLQTRYCSVGIYLFLWKIWFDRYWFCFLPKKLRNILYFEDLYKKYVKVYFEMFGRKMHILKVYFQWYHQWNQFGNNLYIISYDRMQNSLFFIFFSFKWVIVSDKLWTKWDFLTEKIVSL